MSPTNHGDVLSWASTIEPEALVQAQTAAALPFVVKPLALMPDAHVGKGATVGSVIATDGAIIPSAVGVDIGCGMAALAAQAAPQGGPQYAPGWIADQGVGLVATYALFAEGLCQFQHRRNMLQNCPANIFRRGVKLSGHQAGKIMIQRTDGW